jgi:hypothetical protein
MTGSATSGTDSHEGLVELLNRDGTLSSSDKAKLLSESTQSTKRVSEVFDYFMTIQELQSRTGSLFNTTPTVQMAGSKGLDENEFDEEVRGFLSSLLFDSASIRNLTVASLHNDSANFECAPYGYYLHKFEAITSFTSAALFAPIHLITNLFLAIVSSPFALLSNEAKTYCVNHLIHTAFDVAALAIGIIGIFSADTGQALFSKLINKL